MKPSSRHGREPIRTFVTTDLRQGLSFVSADCSVCAPETQPGKCATAETPCGSRSNGKSFKLHPKVEALADLAESIALTEIEKVRADPTKWFSKVLVFNKLIGGTAPHLREVLTKRLTPVFANYLEEVLHQSGLGTRADCPPLFDRA